MSLNLHAIVRSAINANYQDAKLKIYRSLGQQNVNGLVTAAYAPAEDIEGNFQSESDAALDHAELAGQNTIIRKLYLFACDDRKTRPWSIYRPLARSGDYIEDSYGGLWLITAVLEDFSSAGWESVRCTFQQTPVNLTIVEDDNDEKEDETDSDNPSTESDS